MGDVAALAEQRKLEKYSCFLPSHSVVPVAIESLGAIGPLSLVFLNDLGRKIRQRIGEVRACQYLLQQLSMAVQRGNALCILGLVGGITNDSLLRDF